MTGKLAAAFLLITLVLIFIPVGTLLAASQPVSSVITKATVLIGKAPVYGFGGAEYGSGDGVMTAPTKSLASGVATRAAGMEIGITTYDYQHNCSMGRQVEHRGGDFVHFDWMRQTQTVQPGDRRIFYQVANSNCQLEMPVGGEAVNSDYGGYVSIDAESLMRAIPAGHAGSNNLNMSSKTYYDFSLFGPEGLFSYYDFPDDLFGWYQNQGTGPSNQNLWPKIDLQEGTETVLHMVCAESGGALGDPQTLSYYRRVGPYADDTLPGGLGAEWSAQRLIDTVMNINVVVASSPMSDKVAIAWNAPADYRRDQGTEIEYFSQYENDIWYAVSTDQGLSWITDIGIGSIGHEVDDNQHNLTQYDSLSPWKAYCDMSALISSDDNLHIVWGCRKWEGAEILYRRQSAIFHWSEDVSSVRTVVKAEWDTGGFCFGHAWGGDVAKMSISECDSKLYVLFSQFGNTEAPCFDTDSASQIVNGELYLTVSNNQGLNWDRPQNLTNTISDSCAPGNCESDYWASMARYGRVLANPCQGIQSGNVLDIVYVNDRAAGGVIQDGAGIWTTNPVMWLVTPCREIVPEPAYQDDAAEAYGECYDAEPLVLKAGQDTALTFTIVNEGTQDNNFYTSVTFYEAPGWIVITPPEGTVPMGLNNSQDITLQISAPIGLPDPAILTADVIINHEAEGTPRIIPVCLMVTSNFVYPQDALLSTACTRLKVFNSGELVRSTEGAALDFEGDCDTLNEFTNSAIYLDDGSPIICRINEANDTLRFMAYAKSFTDDDGLRPLSDIALDQSNPYYERTWAHYATADTTIGFTAEYFMPKNGSQCSFVIERLKFFNMTNQALTGVLVGEIIDWDVPSDSLVDNGSGYDLSRQMIYQIGAEYNQDDAYEAVCPQESHYRYGAVAAGPGFQYKNAMTLSNPEYIYLSGPYGQEAPMPPGVTYEMMKENDMFILYNPSHPDSEYIDLSTLVTFGEYSLAVGDTQCVINILATTRDGLVGLTDVVDNAHDFIGLHPEIGCTIGCDIPGDANHDGVANFGDVVFIMNYIFKHGPEPAFIAEADANADGEVNIGDVIHLVNFIFKAGPDPICPQR